MKILAIDLETTGIQFSTTDVEKDIDCITEIGMVMTDTAFGNADEPYPPVIIYSQLINEDNRPKMHPEAYEVTHLTEETLQRWGIKPSTAYCNYIASIISKADYIVACGGNRFDKPVLTNFMAKYGVAMPEKQWLDLQQDVNYPGSCKAKNQTYLAGYHGTVNPFAHRAVTDCLMMFKILGDYNADGLKYPIEDIIKNATAVKIKIQAVVSFDDKDLAKADGFKWDGDGKSSGQPKTWWKQINECDYDPENYIFETRIIG